MPADVPSFPIASQEAPKLTVCEAGRRIEGSWIWRQRSLAVAAGDRLAVVGPSGSGKTLLLRALAGLDPLDEGTIAFEGRSLTDWPLPVYRAQVMYLPQAPAFFEGTVEQNLKHVFHFAVHRDKSYDAGWMLQHLELLGQTEHFLSRHVNVLSAGEQQITALLRALQLHPKVLLLDEPTANVDEERTRQIEMLLTNWMEVRPEAALIWTSHDAAQVERMTYRRVDLSAAPPAASLPSNTSAPLEGKRGP